MRHGYLLPVFLLATLAAHAGETRYYEKTFSKPPDQNGKIRSYNLEEHADFAEFCRNFGTALASEKPGSNIAVMNERGGSCWTSPRFVTGNETYIVVLSTIRDYWWTEPSFDVCGPRPVVLPINGAGGGGKSSSTGTGGTSEIARLPTPAQTFVTQFQRFPTSSELADQSKSYATAFISQPRKCYAPSIALQLSGFKIVVPPAQPDPNDKPFAISRKFEQYTRYFAGLQIGVIASRNRDQTFGLKPGPDRIIYSKSPTGSTPQFVASIVFYGVPNYLYKRGYEGRDLVNEKGFADKLGISVGTSVSDPTRRAIAGVSYELGSAIDLFVGAEYVRVQTLNGLKLGDALPGTGSDIPIHDVGKKSVVFGLTLDATYVSGLFHK
jgi:hypothetical protein